MAPDKIYIWPMLNPSDGYVGIAWAEAHGGMKEYIRKDALLEWLKENGYEDTDRISVETIIDKINSL